jgi:superfamily II DNA helicase RecQ
VWRRTRADQDEVPPYVVFDNKTLDAIARTRPQSLPELAALPGVGPVKLERYGSEVLQVVGTG